MASANAGPAGPGRGLGARLLVVMLLAAIPTLGLIIYASLRDRSREMEHARQHALEAARIVATEEHRLIDTTRELLVAIGHLEEIRTGEAEQCGSTMRRLLGELPRYTNLGATDEDGRVLCSARSPAHQVHVGDRRYFREAMRTGELGIGTHEGAAAAGTPAVTLGYPIQHGDGPRVGIVFATLDLATLSLLEQQIEHTLPPGSALLKLDSNGHLIARQPPADGAGGSSPPEALVPEDALSDTAGVFEAPRRGQDASRVYAHAPVQSPLHEDVWHVLLELPAASVYAEPRWLLERNLIGLALLLGLGGLAAWIASRKLVVQPVDELVAVARRLSRGDPAPEPRPTAGSAEIVELRLAFDEMAASIRERERERDAALERLRSFVEDAPSGFLRTTEAGEILMANPAAVEMLGYGSREELLAQNMANVYADPEERPSHLAKYRSEGVVRGITLRWKTKDGDEIVVRLTGRATRDAERGQRVYEVVVEDVTEQQALQRQLVQAQKMEAVGRLAAGLAHDFNNLLTAILANTQMALTKMDESSASRQGLEDVMSLGQRGADLTRKLLAIGRYSPTERRHVEIDALVGETTAVLGRLVEENIDVRWSPGAGVATVDGDPLQLEQVLVNLAVNARDAMPQGGVLRIETETTTEDDAGLRLTGLPAGRYAVLRVTDDGQGMDEPTLQRIFDPFFTTKEEGKGTGLGLATVYGIVEEHGGAILVESEPGHGTEFRVFLPVVPDGGSASDDARTDADRAPVSRPPDDTPATILVVEDEPSVRRVTVQILEEAGHRVLSVEDPRDAETVLARRQGEIDLLLTDIVMPGMDGRTLYARLAERRPGLAVLFMSGHAPRHDGPDLDDADFLQKPFEPGELVDRVRDALDRKRRG